MTYHRRYHPDLKDKDLPNVNRSIQKRIKAAIELRLRAAPERDSEPLKRTPKGHRKLRGGDYLIVLKLEKETILILGICHSKDIWERMECRIQ